MIILDVRVQLVTLSWLCGGASDAKTCEATARSTNILAANSATHLQQPHDYRLMGKNMNRRTAEKQQRKTIRTVGMPAAVQPSSSQIRWHSVGAVRNCWNFDIRKLSLGASFAAMIAVGIPAYATEAVWKDGIMYTQEDVASLQGHKAVKIVFGLGPGKCTGELTAVSEWLKMTQGRLVQTYPGKGDVERVAGDEWFQENGTKVVLCNKTAANAILVGMQFKKE